MTTFTEPRSASPALPQPRGDLSRALSTALRNGSSFLLDTPQVSRADPYGGDLQLALYMLYELHYQSFKGVDEEHEWNPALLAFRRALESRFLSALRADVQGRTSADEVIAEVLVEPAADDGTSVSHYLQREGSLAHMQEYAALRSLYHLKEADPHAWVIPRLHGRAKAAMVAVEYDEFGAGRAENVHARLFADLMNDLGLDTAYGRYLDAAPTEAIATVNLMSLFGLHRSLRGALIGHFAAVEITSSPGSRRLAQAMRRLGAGTAAERFYAEHVEADAVHEQVVRHEIIAPLLAAEPHLEPDVAFGIEATSLLEDRLAQFLLRTWRGDGSALRPMTEAADEK
jgi:hypothetical protein